MYERKTVPYDQIQIGDTAERSFFVSRASILSFSKVIEDENSFHVTEEAAKTVEFNDIIAHGVHLLSFISRTIGEGLPGFGTLYLSQEVRFLKPVPADTKILTRVTVIEKKDKRRILLRTEILDEYGEEHFVDGHGVVKTMK